MSSSLIHTNRANEDVERQLKSGGPETFDSAPSFLNNSTHGKLSTTLYAYIEDIYNATLPGKSEFARNLYRYVKTASISELRKRSLRSCASTWLLFPYSCVQQEVLKGKFMFDYNNNLIEGSNLTILH